jgi:hypothetical protein
MRTDEGTTRREILRASIGGGIGLALGASASGCIVPSRPPPVIEHPHYPLGPLVRRRVSGARLLAGAAAIDISPPKGSRPWVAGFGFQRTMSGVRDPLSARCLYFDDGTHRVALVVADLIGLLRPSVQRVRRLVGSGVRVVVASTHNHQGPDTMGYWGKSILYALPVKSGVDPEYQRVLERRLAASVLLAARAAVPARVSLARGTIPKNLVRNLRNPGVYDERIEVMDLTAEEGGSTIATFVNFACHPETLGDRNHAMTADFPGVLRKRIESERGGTAVFANGSLGGMITPELEDNLDTKERASVMEHLGDSIASAALDSLRRAERVEISSVRYRARTVELPSGNELFRYIERVGLVERRERGVAGGLITEVGRIDFGPACWALVPGEPTPMVGSRIKKRMEEKGVAHPALIALANDELGYILDPAQYDDPRFSYEVSVSVGRETAPRIEHMLDTMA